MAPCFEASSKANQFEQAHELENVASDRVQLTTDPSHWQGASPAARFGLDIGGTLCKVVYFEPLSGEESLQAGVAGRNCCAADPMHCCRGEFVHAPASTSGREADNEASISGPHDLGPGGSIGRDAKVTKLRVVPAGSGEFKELQDRRFGKGGVEQARAGSGGAAKRARARAKEQQARKLWTSSHDPINVPGRGTLHFKRFETACVEEFLALSREHCLVNGNRVIGATGGGARKFGDRFREQAGLHLQKHDELTCLVRGIDFLVRHAWDDSFEYPIGQYRGGGMIQRALKASDSCTSSDESGDERGGASDGSVSPQASPGDNRQLEEHSAYPYLVVNIGSGVSMLRVDGVGQFERVGGTSLGGSTFLGLASALAGCNSFAEAIELASRGDSTSIDMLVGDIYGGDYTEMGLAATVVASSFGKLTQPAMREAASERPADLAKACLLMVTNNLGSLAMLHARAAGVRKILFAGSFLHGNKLAMKLLSVAVEFWSQGMMKAVFMRHEGHAGAVGALLGALEPGVLDFD